MAALLRWLKLQRLRLRELGLQNEVDHGEALIRDHVHRFTKAKRDLARVQREIDAIARPSDLIGRRLI